MADPKAHYSLGLVMCVLDEHRNPMHSAIVWPACYLPGKVELATVFDPHYMPPGIVGDWYEMAGALEGDIPPVSCEACQVLMDWAQEHPRDFKGLTETRRALTATKDDGEPTT